MEQFKEIIKKLFELGGIEDFVLDVDSESRRIAIFFPQLESKEVLPKMIAHIEQVVNLIARRHGVDNIIVDINNYRRERERLIGELAKAAARKVLLSKAEIALPAMNAYERRLVHMELVCNWTQQHTF